MKRSSILGAAALLAASSSVAFGLVVRHMEYAAAVAGKDGSPIHGAATMKSSSDAKGTVIDLKLMGVPAGETHPWHVHMGSCAKSGGVWGGGANYKPLVADAKGNGESKATIAMALPDTGSYYVNIHESSTNMGKIVACGDLKMKM
jgi:Cu-Zn family superoxide dismutase